MTGGLTASPSATLALPTPHPTDRATEEADLYIGGTITWTATGTDESNPVTTESSTGTANVVIHVIDPNLLLAEREDHNTYSYNYSSKRDPAPPPHEEGTLESQAGVGTTDPTGTTASAR